MTLDELLDRNARQTLEESAGDFDVPLSIIDREGGPLIGPPPPAAAREAEIDFETLPLEVEGRLYAVSPILHEGTPIGRMVVGPFDRSLSQERAGRLARHLERVVEAFVLEGIRRALSARMHMATVEEASRELTEKNRKLGQLVERLQEADRLKSNFLATVSHELRTPLTSVIGYSEMLLEGIAGALNEEQREYVRTVMEKGDQLLQLITGILDISRMEAGEMRFDKVAFDLSEVVSVALSTIAPQARRKRILLSCNLAPDLPRAFGDRDKVRQVLLNLLDNAIKFTPEGGKVQLAAEVGGICAARVRCRTPCASRCATPGSAFPPSNRSAMFDPFFQVDNSSTREYGGTGLGLSASSSRFVEAHGGAVWVESGERRGGLTFYFTIPLAPADVPEP